MSMSHNYETGDSGSGASKDLVMIVFDEIQPASDAFVQCWFA
jgi:hypothetical protein